MAVAWLNTPSPNSGDAGTVAVTLTAPNAHTGRSGLQCTGTATNHGVTATHTIIRLGAAEFVHFDDDGLTIDVSQYAGTTFYLQGTTNTPIITFTFNTNYFTFAGLGFSTDGGTNWTKPDTNPCTFPNDPGSTASFLYRLYLNDTDSNTKGMPIKAYSDSGEVSTVILSITHVV